MCHANKARHIPKYRYDEFTPFKVMFFSFRVRLKSESRRLTSHPSVTRVESSPSPRSSGASKSVPATSAQYVGGSYATFFQNSRSSAACVGSSRAAFEGWFSGSSAMGLKSRLMESGFFSTSNVRNRPLRPVACCVMAFSTVKSTSSYPRFLGVQPLGGTMRPMPYSSSCSSMLSTYFSSDIVRISSSVG